VFIYVFILIKSIITAKGNLSMYITYTSTISIVRNNEWEIATVITATETRRIAGIVILVILVQIFTYILDDILAVRITFLLFCKVRVLLPVKDLSRFDFTASSFSV